MGTLLAPDVSLADQFPPLRLRLDHPRARLPDHRALALLRNEGAPQVRYTRGGSNNDDLLVRRLHCASSVPKR